MARILTLTNWYPPHAFGGYEVVCQDAMDGLRARGHHIEVLCSTERRGSPDLPEGEIPVHRLLQMYWRHDRPWAPGFSEQLRIERANHAALVQTLETVAPDVVSVWHMGALSLSLLTAVQQRGLPMVFGIADDWPTYALALDPWSGRWNEHARPGRLAARLLRTPTVLGDVGAMGRFCFISDVTRQRCEEAAPWAFPAAAVVHAGVELSRFPLADDEPPRSWQGRLLYVGRLDTRKGTHTLLQAMAQLPADVTLTLCTQTQGEALVEHQVLSDQLGLGRRIRFMSAEHDEVAAVYRTHDCVVFSSEWPEPFGLVPLEAMACGTPVIATGVGGSAEFLVDGENCIIYPPGDHDALAAMVTRLAGDDALRTTLQAHGRTTARTFNASATADAYDHWHRTALTERPNS